MGVWLFVLYALAVCRATGLITADVITEPLRDGLIRRLGAGVVSAAKVQSTDHIVDVLRDESRPRWVVAKLSTCAWCTGLWVSGIAAPLVWLYGAKPWLLIPALALAFGQIVGMTAGLGRE